MRNWILWLIFLGYTLPIYTQESKSDSIRFSLLTCAPGEEIYSLFGHTAIRYENYTRKQDFVFNYGMFSFNTPNFVMRFLLGETDYQLGVVPFPYFQMEYAERGSSVYQQVLNLTTEEKSKLLQLLDDNYHPSNRTYRYNYFYDNCTSRARNKIEECINGDVVYEEPDSSVSFRDIIREYTAGHPWDALGIDLCLGDEADVPIDYRNQMFAPFVMLDAAKNATIHRGDSIVPFIQTEEMVVQTESVKVSSPFLLSPMMCAMYLLLITCWICWLGFRQGRVIWLWDVLLFGAQGLGGCLIAALFFFSVHPTVDSNWMILLFNPIPLLYLPIMVYRAIKRQKDYYHWMNVVYLTIFVLSIPFIPQKMNLTVLPLTLCLLVNSVGHLIIYYKKECK